MKIVIHLAAILLLLTSVSYAQSTAAERLNRPLSIGDTIPDLQITGLLNYPKHTVNFSEFRGKFVLLDFWFGACPGCIDLFPKMEALQKKFGDKLQILMVNFESLKQIEATMKKWQNKSPNYRKPLLPSVVEDTILHQLFSIRYYPHEVWIDQRGVVQAITDGSQVTEANLADMIAGKPAKFDLKADNLVYNGEEAYLLQVAKAALSPPRYYSSLFNYTPGLQGGWYRLIIDSAQKTARVTRRNYTILQLFMDAYYNSSANPTTSPIFDFGKRVILNISDSSRYLYSQRAGETAEEWKIKNCFTYETVLPLYEEANVSKIMIDDLEKYFGVKCKIERRRKKCLVLVKINQFDSMKLEKRFPATSGIIADSSKIQFAACTTDWLLEGISAEYRNTPYIFANNTQYQGQFSFEVPKSIIKDLSQFKAFLRSTYGMDLIETETDVDFFVFADN